MGSYSQALVTARERRASIGNHLGLSLVCGITGGREEGRSAVQQLTSISAFGAFRGSRLSLEGFDASETMPTWQRAKRPGAWIYRVQSLLQGLC